MNDPLTSKTGATLSFGDHACLIYENMSDYRAVMMNYIISGLENNEKVVCVIDEYPKDLLIQDLNNLGINTTSLIQSGQLVISSIESVYVGVDGFDASHTIEYSINRILDEKSNNFNGLRVMGEMLFSLDGKQNTIDKLIDYEFRFNIECMPVSQKHTYLCVFNKNKFPTYVLELMIKAHPVVINNTTLIKPSPYYVEPKKYLKEHYFNKRLRHYFALDKNYDNNLAISIDKKNNMHANILKYVLTATGDGIWGWDAASKNFEFSDTLASILGYSKDDIPKEFDSFLQLVHPKDALKYKEKIYQCVLNVDEFFNCEARFKTKYDDWVWLLIKGVVMQKDGNGEVEKIVGIFNNITTSKEYEANLKISKERAEEASNLKSQFLSTVTHELRTPLNGIIGATTLLCDTSLDMRQQEYVDLISDSSKRLYHLVDRILDLSKIEAGKVEMEKIEFNLDAACKSVINRFKLDALNKNINLIYNWDRAIPKKLIGDPNRLNQVLYNLVSNALKFTKEGKVTLDIQRTNIASNCVEIEFSIKDTGIGIPKNSFHKLFKPFSQIDSSKSRKYGGTGLGLDISRRLIELMGGKLQVESIEGIGSRFYFTLKYLIKKNMYNTVSTEALDLDINVQSISILLAEDDFINQKVIKYMLEKMGFHVDVATTGKEVIDILNVKEFSAILMDIDMPEMDGFEATRIIKDKNIQIPIIALTASAMQEDKIKCMELGMTNFLSKPVSKEELIQSLNNVISLNTI